MNKPESAWSDSLTTAIWVKAKDQGRCNINKAALSTGQLACLTRLEDAHTVLLQQRRYYLVQARIKAREAQTQQSFAELELFPTSRSYGFRLKKLELEKEAEQLRGRAEAIDELLRHFALQKSRVGNR